VLLEDDDGNASTGEDQRGEQPRGTRAGNEDAFRHWKAFGSDWSSGAGAGQAATA
jgi:hypothetical protein